MMMMYMGILLFLMTSHTRGYILQSPDTDYCLSKDPVREQFKHFATKTAYQFVRGNENIMEECLPLKFWLLTRHGTRYPSAKDIAKISEILPGIQENISTLANKTSILNSKKHTLCKEDLDLLSTWRWDSTITADKAEFLSSQGWADLHGLAGYYQKQFPTLLKNKYSKNNFFFRHTDTQRTKGSFQAFAEGLFGSYEHVKAASIPENDTLLRPYDYLAEWKNQEEKIYEEGSEYEKFKESKYLLDLVEQVSKKAGNTVNLKTVEIMFKACTYQQAWRIDELSPWCALFTPEQVKVLEYLHDLEEFYRCGSSSNLNRYVTEELLDNLLDFLISNAEPKVVAYFAHSTTVELFLTSLNIAVDDTSPTADNYEEMVKRKWRTSEIAPFSSNLAAIDLLCETTPRRRFVFMLNERLLEVPWCQDTTCTWGEILRKKNKVENSLKKMLFHTFRHHYVVL
ncbi:hypothetical protein DMENIID0001_044730 [Sergentomyia squamirostris]